MSQFTQPEHPAILRGWSPIILESLENIDMIFHHTWCQQDSSFLKDIFSGALLITALAFLHPNLGENFSFPKPPGNFGVLLSDATRWHQSPRKVGLLERLGRASITPGLWCPAPWPGTLPAPEEMGSELNTPGMGCWQGNPSAVIQLFSRTQLVLDQCWINSRSISEVGSEISHLSESFHFSALFPLCSISHWCEGLHLQISGATYLCSIEIQFRSETHLEMRHSPPLSH